ncbi:MAG: LysM peptidoglycan-binding domain-containing protein [Acidimicrobiia bacterium]|jgi:LysM repeat protein|nr:LysM peptidoglycan-binding domain-containing protein [Acidimicrobiia bacterium]
MTGPNATHGEPPATVPTAAVCPYLLSADGGWRASTPSRDHRCNAVVPPTVLAADKQRRLCLASVHTSCATFEAAAGRVEERSRSSAGSDRPGFRPTVRTTPLVMDRGRVIIPLPGLRGERGFGQAGILSLMGLAFAAVLIARLSAGTATGSPGDTERSGGVATASPDPTVLATSKPTSAPSASSPDRTLVPTEVEPSGSSGTPDELVAPALTHKVKSGETLSGIAATFGTTWKVLAELNGIDDPARLRVGQVLQLP